jgi:hypothetical protein
MIISHSIILRMKNVLEKICRANQNRHFMFNKCFLETFPFMRYKSVVAFARQRWLQQCATMLRHIYVAYLLILKQSVYVVCSKIRGRFGSYICLTHWRPEDSDWQASTNLLNHFFCQSFAECVGVGPLSIFPVSALNFETACNQN